MSLAIYIFIAVAGAVHLFQLVALCALVYERFSNRRFKRQAAAVPVVKAAPLHPDALRNRALKEK